MSACLCRVGTGVLRCLFGFTLFQVNKILCLVCVCRAYAWLVTCPQVLTDGLCFVRELLKCNFSYISSATVGFIHMQTEGILPAAQWMARLGLLREPLTEIALHVAFYIKKKKKMQQSEPPPSSCGAGPSVWTIWQIPAPGRACRAPCPVTHGGKPCMNRGTAHFISRNIAYI